MGTLAPDVLLPRGLVPSEARALQTRLRTRVSRVTPSRFDPRLVAGADVSILRGRDVGHAAIVVLDLATLENVEEATGSVEVSFPYVPGLLSFRELPPLVAAWEKLSTRPDLVVFDAHGLAHPRRFGLACHGGLLFDVPAIGAAKSVLVGEAGPLGQTRGSQSDLVYQEEAVGRVLRTRSEVRPVYVSIGHRISLEAAVDLVARMCPRFRLPEPIRRAHHLSNRVRLGRS